MNADGCRNGVEKCGELLTVLVQVRNPHISEKDWLLCVNGWMLYGGEGFYSEIQGWTLFESR
jgi:hypothetical protein